MSGASSDRAARAVAAVRDPWIGHGKLEIAPKVTVRDLDDVATLYTPGVGYLVRAIVDQPDLLASYSNRENTIAVVTDGTAVLGLGSVGPGPALPVMEGKAIMFKLLAGLDAVPVCLDVRDADHLVGTIAALEPTFAGINLEDVAAPHCFEVVRRLESRLSIPVLHDDQYGTATVLVAAVRNALKVLGKSIENTLIVVNGAGAAGTATTRLLLAAGAGDIVVCERDGILGSGGSPKSEHWAELAGQTNRIGRTGNLRDALVGADVFIGLSTARVLDPDWIREMGRDPVVFGCANPEPEIMPDVAAKAGAAVTGSGRFDFPNQCNNVLAFPGLMRGAVAARATRVSHGMCLAAARAIADHVPETELNATNVLPSPLDPELCPRVAEAVVEAAKREGLARRPVEAGEVAETVRQQARHAARFQEMRLG